MNDNIISPICDFCIHYRDKNEGTNKGFYGIGICDIDGSVIQAYYSCDDNFESFKTEK